MKKNNDLSPKKLPASVKSYIKHLERVRSDFVANVSHELRTPLTVIQGYLETLLKQNADVQTDQAKILNRVYLQMQQHSIRMANIIENLLLLSDLEREDNVTDTKEGIVIADMLKALHQDAKNISGDKQHKITLQADNHLALKGCENELRSLFSNIIINAIKYTPPQGIIAIKWHSNKKQQSLFTVTDSGIGIAKEHIPRITERFYRVDKGRTREQGGTGLGLAIVKHVLLRHQSELIIKSTLGKGSTFTCVFPPERTLHLSATLSSN